MTSLPFEVVTRASQSAPRRDSARAETADGAFAAARQLLAEARAAGYGEPVCEFIIDGRVVLIGMRYRDLGA